MPDLRKIMGKRIRADGWILGFGRLAHRVLQKLRSRGWGLILNAPGIDVGPGCRFLGARFIRFGRDISINCNLWLEAVTEFNGQAFSPEIRLGDRVRLSDAVHITAIRQILIGNDVLFGSRVYVSDHNHGAYRGDSQTPPMEPPSTRRLHSEGSVVIEDNVWIGDGVNIVGPAKIGFGAVIAANSVVRGDVPAQTIVAGAPARVIKTFNPGSGMWEKSGR